jgi:hypothetical protein
MLTMLTISRTCLLLLTGSTAVHADVFLPLTAANNVGFLRKTLEPVLTVSSGEEVKVEMATHRGCDDYYKMISGDATMEEIYAWDETQQPEKCDRCARLQDSRSFELPGTASSVL